MSLRISTWAAYHIEGRPATEGEKQEPFFLPSPPTSGGEGRKKDPIATGVAGIASATLRLPQSSPLCLPAGARRATLPNDLAVFCAG